jgi:hypothetical protein
MQLDAGGERSAGQEDECGRVVDAVIDPQARL